MFHFIKTLWQVELESLTYKWWCGRWRATHFNLNMLFAGVIKAISWNGKWLTINAPRTIWLKFSCNIPREALHREWRHPARIWLGSDLKVTCAPSNFQKDAESAVNGHDHISLYSFNAPGRNGIKLPGASVFKVYMLLICHYWAWTCIISLFMVQVFMPLVLTITQQMAKSEPVQLMLANQFLCLVEGTKFPAL